MPGPDGAPPLALPAELAKGGRARTIPLNEPAREAVLAILLFNRQRGFSVAADAPLSPNRAISTRAVRRSVGCGAPPACTILTPPAPRRAGE